MDIHRFFRDGFPFRERLDVDDALERLREKRDAEEAREERLSGDYEDAEGPEGKFDFRRQNTESRLRDIFQEVASESRRERAESRQEAREELQEAREERQEAREERREERVQDRRDEKPESLRERLQERVQDRREEKPESLRERLQERVQDRREEKPESLRERLQERVQDRREDRPESLRERFQDRREEKPESLRERLQERVENRQDRRDDRPESLRERLQERVQDRREEKPESLRERLQERVQDRREEKPESLRERFQERREERMENRQDRREEKPESLRERLQERVQDRRDEKPESLRERLRERLQERVQDRREEKPESLRERFQDRREERMENRQDRREEKPESLRERLQERMQDRREEKPESLRERREERVQDRREEKPESLRERREERVQDRREDRPESLRERFQERMQDRREEKPESLRERFQERREERVENRQERVENRQERRENLETELKRLSSALLKAEGADKSIFQKLEARLQEAFSTLPRNVVQALVTKLIAGYLQGAASATQRAFISGLIDASGSVEKFLAELKSFIASQSSSGQGGMLLAFMEPPSQFAVLAALLRKAEKQGYEALPPQGGMMTDDEGPKPENEDEDALEEIDGDKEGSSGQGREEEHEDQEDEGGGESDEGTEEADEIPGPAAETPAEPFRSEDTLPATADHPRQQEPAETDDAGPAGLAAEESGALISASAREKSEPVALPREAPRGTARWEGRDRQGAYALEREEGDEGGEDEPGPSSRRKEVKGSLREKLLSQQPSLLPQSLFPAQVALVTPERRYEPLVDESEEDLPAGFSHSSQITRWFYIFVFYQKLLSKNLPYARFTSSFYGEPSCYEEQEYRSPEDTIEEGAFDGLTGEEFIGAVKHLADQGFEEAYLEEFNEPYLEPTIDDIRNDAEFSDFFAMLDAAR
ncbi:MAG: hypothetical protein RDV48_13860 [Candidatus Eremiobacteraeota bacterium]|nr:hypothetical protein [Candidatus Eremiobacteraeota bacterium]